jgi:phosphate:Na+ symporter
MAEFDIWMFVAGLGLFLFGMKELESALASLGGNTMRAFLRKSTYTTGRGIATGIFSTAVLQSSSVVTLMLLAFVGAGILSFQQAIGVVLGANLGTTVTGWLVAFFGFSFKIQSFALPLVGIGALGQVFLSSKPRWRDAARLLTGFGLLFFGLDFMKSSIDAFAAGIDLRDFANYPAVIFVAVGLVFTALVQSSSATMVIALSALNAGVISFPAAGSLIIGANLGTTVTILLGSMGGKGTVVKRKVAYTHFLFNLLTAAVAIPLLGFLSWIIIELWEVENPLYELTAFHTLFNAMGILIFLPLVKPIARWLDRKVVDHRQPVTRFIHRLPAVEYDASIAALYNELLHMTEGVYLLIFNLMHLPAKTLASGLDPAEERVWKEGKAGLGIYEDIKNLELEMLEFYAHLQRQHLAESQSMKLNRYMAALRNLSYAAKAVKDILNNLQQLRQSENASARQFLQEIMGVEQSILQSVEKTLLMMDDEAVLKALQEGRETSKRFYQRFMKAMYTAISEGQISENEMSDLIRVNRELYNTNKFLMRGVMAFKLESGDLVEQQLDEGTL